MSRSLFANTDMYNRVFLLTLQFLLLYASLSSGKEVSLMELEEVTDLIMSPGCNYIYTLTNCPSAEAEQMRELVKDRLAKGESKESILAYFEGVYGPRILAQPSKKGFYFVAWWFPYFLLLDVLALAGVFLVLWRRRSRRKAGTSGDDAVETSDKEMERFLEEELRRFNQE